MWVWNSLSGESGCGSLSGKGGCGTVCLGKVVFNSLSGEGGCGIVFRTGGRWVLNSLLHLGMVRVEQSVWERWVWNSLSGKVGVELSV